MNTPRSLFLLFAFLIAPFLHAQSSTQTPAAHPNAEAPAQTATPTPPAKNDYSKPDTWICRPGRQDSCTVDLSTTVITADGKLSVEKFTPNPNPSIDCFYVYPTISTQQTPNADMSLDPEEKAVVRSQFARFGSQCRLFAPLYRQVTLLALRDILRGTSPPPEVVAQERITAYTDVLDAFHYYLQHDNNGRPLVLIGHSQGAGILEHLIQNEIDGKPIQSQLLSAMLIGANVDVPKGKDVGGAFQHISLCHSPSQTGCLITYVSFRAASPPPENSRFARTSDPGMSVACTNPAALSGGSAELHSYLVSNDSNNFINRVTGEQLAWVTPPQPINTSFVSVPGMLTAECLSNDHASYLAVTVHAADTDARAHNISGDLVVGGRLLSDWGLHVIDMNLTMGNLVDIVRQQSSAYAANSKKK
jgi:Protein of unknown function (DUF3089)